MFRL
ncbi:hypothetical protein YPPY88_1561, partial [Yersinia pestis PY-88]|jgi:hypothetical protein